MIFGVGIDMIDVARVLSSIEKSAGFREKVFSKNEIEYCESKGSAKGEHYAVRFAGKEAFLKATGEGLALTHDLHEIEIALTATGKPEIHLRGSLNALMKERRWSKLHLSLSHTGTASCAIVIIETLDEPVA